jgi:hypothetical protein
MAKPGRRRKATYDFEKLIRYDREGITSWVRDMMGHGNYDLSLLVTIERWVNRMDTDKYKKLRDVVAGTLKQYEGPTDKKPSNVIPFPNMTNRGAHG